jgi:hypothetical protein
MEHHRESPSAEEQIWEMIDQLSLPHAPSGFWEQQELWNSIEILPQETMAYLENVWDKFLSCQNPTHLHTTRTRAYAANPPIEPPTAKAPNSQHQSPPKTHCRCTDTSSPENDNESRGSGGDTHDDSNDSNDSNDSDDSFPKTTNKIRFKMTEAHSHKTKLKKNMSFRANSSHYNKPERNTAFKATAKESQKTEWKKSRSLTIETSDENMMEGLRDMFGAFNAEGRDEEKQYDEAKQGAIVVKGDQNTSKRLLLQ